VGPPALTSPSCTRHAYSRSSTPRSSARPIRAVLEHANAKVTLTVYAGLTGDGRDKGVAKLAECGFGA
jgi:hypothetical protein